MPSAAASQAAIVAGGKACVGTTADPAGEPTRIAGWAPVTGVERDKLHTDGDVVTRDNVMLVYRTGIDGGCVILAKSDPQFDAAGFYSALGSAIGITIPPGDGKQPPQVDLPNGELMIVVIAPHDGAQVVTLVVANRAGKHMQKGN